MIYKIGIIVLSLALWTFIVYNIGKKSQQLKYQILYNKELAKTQQLMDERQQENNAIESSTLAQKDKVRAIYRDKIIMRYKLVESKYRSCLIESNDINDINEALK